MKKKRLIYSLIITILLFAIFFSQTKINDLKKEYGLNLNSHDPSERIPILLMGGFRSLAIDLLWIRGIARHEEKKYYETMAINNLITKLQPDFPDVWTFQAWNMASNIAHEWQAPENKWKWIKAGLKFAKEGAVKNPESADLAFEVGYMYFQLFKKKIFRYADYNRQRLKEDWNEDNYLEAAFWFKKAILYESDIINSAVMHRMICHSMWRAALQAEHDRRFNDALNYIEESITEWNGYLEKYPDDPLGKAGIYLPEIEQKRQEIIIKTRNN